jgi:hypothetical protein
LEALDMRTLLLRGLLGVLAAALLVFLSVPEHAVGKTTQNPTGIHLELDPAQPVWQGPVIPPNCSSWHEIVPSYCTLWHQDDYYDATKDSIMNACDFIKLNGKWYHIEWVGPTYWVTCYRPNQPPVTNVAAEPEIVNPGSNPVCEYWHWIYPPAIYCQRFHIDSYHPAPGNTGGTILPCDFIDVIEPDPNGLPVQVDYHIDRIGCNIIIIPMDPTGTKSKSWGWLKNLFRK